MPGVLADMYLFLCAVIAFMLAAIIVRAHDGSATGRAELARDIEEDTD
jgi:hypothetical protein